MRPATMTRAMLSFLFTQGGGGGGGGGEAARIHSTRLISSARSFFPGNPVKFR